MGIYANGSNNNNNNNTSDINNNADIEHNVSDISEANI